MSNQTSPYDNMDELRRQWQSMELRIDDLERRNRELAVRLNENRISGMRQRLMNYRKRSIALCLMLPFILIPELSVILNLSWWFVAVYGLFFWIMGGVNWLIYRRISRVDLSSTTAEQALVYVYDVRRYLRYGRLIGWTMAIPILIWIFTLLYDLGDPNVIWGGWAGLLIGLAIGFCADYRQRKLLRKLRLEIELANADI